MGNYDGSGSLFALGVRLTKLAPNGAPLTGAENCYVSDALVQMGLGMNYEEGEEIIQKNGAGLTCVYYKPPDTLKSGLIEELIVCTPDPNILEFCWGGEVITSGGVDEEQTVTVTGVPTGGTFTLNYSGQTTAGIPFDATSAEVQTALEALTNLGTGDVVVTGTGPYVVAFAGTLAGQNVGTMTADGSNLTGGTTPDVTVETTTPGGGGPAIGYRAPLVNVDPTPNGVAIECWTRAMLDNAYNPNLPYFHWVLPRAKVRPSETMILGAENAATPQMEGTCEQNAGFGSGPLDDIEFPTDRVWQYCQVANNPTTTSGFVTVP